MSNTDFIIRKLRYYKANFENLTEDEVRQSQYFVIYKANEHINDMIDTNEQMLKENMFLQEMIQHYKQFIKDTGLEKKIQILFAGKECDMNVRDHFEARRRHHAADV